MSLVGGPDGFMPSVFSLGTDSFTVYRNANASDISTRTRPLVSPTLLCHAQLRAAHTIVRRSHHQACHEESSANRLFASHQEKNI